MEVSKVELVEVDEGETTYYQFVDVLRNMTNTVYDSLESVLVEAYVSGFVSVLEDYEVEVPPDAQNAETIAMLVEIIREVVANRQYESFQRLGEVLQLGIRQDWESDQYFKGLQSVLDYFTGRLELILRTETNRAGNFGRNDAMHYLGVNYAKIYTQEDERVCEHRVQNQVLGVLEGCLDFWEGTHRLSVFRLETVEKIIPVHPRCRCYALPIGKLGGLRQTPPRTETPLQRLERLTNDVRNQKRVEYYWKAKYKIVKTIEERPHALAYITKDGTIQVRESVLNLPDEGIRYVIAHEHAHSFSMRHNTTFYRGLETVYPDYKTGQKILEENLSVVLTESELRRVQRAKSR